MGGPDTFHKGDAFNGVAKNYLCARSLLSFQWISRLLSHLGESPCLSRSL